MKHISLTEITKENFAPFGRVVQPYKNTITKAGSGWKCCSPMDFILAEGPVGIGVVYSEEMPERITTMERHVSREEVLWAAKDDLIMLADIPASLGASEGKPDSDTVKAFLIPAGTVIIMNRGTWHSPAFAVKGTVAYYFMVEQKKDFIDQDENPWIPFDGKEEIIVDRGGK